MKPRSDKDKPPTLSGKEIVNALVKDGGTVEKHEGSHARVIYNGNLVIVPIHTNKDLPEGTLKSIIRQTKLSKKQFYNLVSTGLIAIFINKIVMLFSR
ncbi:YcfA-like protein [Oxobacter pfennigii]|uniref:YcfA-like protein n=1 Tax=Oxobacter pfennigii TaxID=36849 RepID=A0A0P8Z0Z0_9CLOT|nr:type II toxin-antitoxin system HicA family toxin [Oxobacter pfennigii]KPU45797.1 YcfA-like protein [Oxobacter pfennigii]